MTVFVLFVRTDPPGGSPGASELAYQLRGGPLWALGGDVRAPREDGSVMLPNVRKRHVAFANLLFLMDNPKIFNSLIDLDVPLIIDVHFPFGAADHILAIQPGAADETRDEQLDEAAADYWSRPETISKALNVLAFATVVTSPRKDWAKLLDSRLRAPVVVLPDISDVRSGVRFFQRFAVIGATALGAGPKGRLGARIGARLLTRWARKQLTALDINWSARRAGTE